MSLLEKDWQQKLIFQRLEFRYGSPIGELSGGGRRSWETKRDQEAQVPVPRPILHWALPSIPLYIITTTAQAQCTVEVIPLSQAMAPCQSSPVCSLCLLSPPRLTPACCPLLPLPYPLFLVNLNPHPTPLPISRRRLPRPAQTQASFLVFLQRDRLQFRAVTRNWDKVWVSTGRDCSKQHIIYQTKTSRASYNF